MLVLFSFSVNAGAEDKFRATDLPLPRFVSLQADKVYARTGPGMKYPVRWTYMRKSLPVEIIREFDTWRKIRDFTGEEGWVHRSLISGRRTALVMGEGSVDMHREFCPESPVIARIENGAVLGLNGCKENWCELASQGFKGWVERKFLWGIYDGEEFN